MLWIALHLPKLALEVFERGRLDPSQPSGQPAASNPLPQRLAVCDRLQVLEACAASRASGVAPGMSRATALALTPDLVIRERDAERERTALVEVAGWALQFTPLVSLEPPDGVLLEVAASLRAFGGLAVLLERLQGGLTELGFSVARGLGPTARGAWLLARAASLDASRGCACPPPGAAPIDAAANATDRAAFAVQLAPLPVRLLEAAQPHLEALDGIGARTIADLLALPREGLARRFGTELLAELDRAQGFVPEPRRWHEAPAVFGARLELFAQVEVADALLFAARRLLAQLAGWLAARQAATTHLALAAHHDDCPPTAIELRLANASCDAERFARLLRERLATVQLPSPAHTLSLACDAVVPLPAGSGQLFATPADARDSLAPLIERLRARLGAARVQQVLPLDDHRPEHAYRIELVTALPAAPRHSRPPRRRATPSRKGRDAHAPAATEDTASAAALEPDRLARPLWLLRKPLPLAERKGRPYYQGALALVAGPERIEGGWWDRELVQRDYFIAEAEDSALYWVYVERGTADAPPAWYLHGRFA